MKSFESAALGIGATPPPILAAAVNGAPRCSARRLPCRRGTQFPAHLRERLLHVGRFPRKRSRRSNGKINPPTVLLTGGRSEDVEEENNV